MLLECGLFIPATFERWARGERFTTWTDREGGLHRIDYVALPVAWMAKTITAGDIPDIDITLDKEDHADGSRLFVYIELGQPGLWSLADSGVD